MRKITKYYFNYFHLLYLHWNSSYCTSSTKTTSPLVMNSRSDLNVSNPSFRGWLTVTLSTTELEPMSIVIGQSLKKTRRSNFQKIISFFFYSEGNDWYWIMCCQRELKMCQSPSRSIRDTNKYHSAFHGFYIHI